MKRAIILASLLAASPLGAQDFTTAAEVKPIVQATKGSWIAVRPWEGQDLLYFTNLLSWRCGLDQITYAVNGGEEIVLEHEPCYIDEGAPNALKVESIMPYVSFEADSIESITIGVFYDDGTSQQEEFMRKDVQIN